MPDFDTADASVIATFGEDVTYTPFGSAAVVIKAFFQNSDDEADTVDVDFEGNTPELRTLSSDTPAPQHQDLFTVRGVDYTVKRVEVDESALVVFHLLEA